MEPIQETAHEEAAMATETITAELEERPFWPAVRKGWRRRCPQCGEGRVLRGYLKLNDSCDCCGLDLTKTRADDGPAYLTILIVGHLMVAGMLHVFMAYRPSPMEMLAIFGIGTVALSLFLLPRFKGVFVGIQWAKRMHGL
ncbi:DUF983 domain-containing protein [Nioella sediminis]|jgi:uncharacterized protein (DUF983 family)|uniref:DUF983 domain-containing protein n=1 Tax=Nioella sediminis TaxID=1912092 RepID=UPI003CCC2070